MWLIIEFQLNFVAWSLPNFVWRLNRIPLFVNYLLVIVGLEIENYLLMIDEFEIVVIAKLMELSNYFRLMKPSC